MSIPINGPHFGERLLIRLSIVVVLLVAQAAVAATNTAWQTTLAAGEQSLSMQAVTRGANGETWLLGKIGQADPRLHFWHVGNDGEVRADWPLDLPRGVELKTHRPSALAASDGHLYALFGTLGGVQLFRVTNGKGHSLTRIEEDTEAVGLIAGNTGVLLATLHAIDFIEPATGKRTRIATAPDHYSFVDLVATPAGGVALLNSVKEDRTVALALLKLTHTKDRWQAGSPTVSIAAGAWCLVCRLTTGPDGGVALLYLTRQTDPWRLRDLRFDGQLNLVADTHIELPFAPRKPPTLAPLTWDPQGLQFAVIRDGKIWLGRATQGSSSGGGLPTEDDADWRITELHAAPGGAPLLVSEAYRYDHRTKTAMSALHIIAFEH